MPMRKSNYDGFQTEKLTKKNATDDQLNIAEYAAMGKAIKAVTEGKKRVRLLLYHKRLRTLPVNITALAKIPYLEIDLSDNPGLILATAFRKLAQLPNLKALDLSGLRMGSLPPEIGLLTSLEQLILYSNSLEELPDELTQLTNLKYLNLHSNKIRDLSPVFALPNLQRLVLRGNYFAKKNFDQIRGLSQLEYLDMRRCGIIRIPDTFTQLSNLRTLDVSANNIRQLPDNFGRLKLLQNINLHLNTHLDWGNAFMQLAALPQLTHLDLSQYDLKELAPQIGQMQHLVSLNLQSNLLKTLPGELQKLPRLQEIKIDYNQELDWEQAFEVLGKVVSLKKLELTDATRQSLPTSLGKLTQLEVLIIKDMPLLEKIPAAIGKLQFLKRLHINQCKALANLPASLGKLSHLEVLDLSDLPNLFESLPSSLTQLKKLKRLCLQNSYIQALPSGIAKLTQLEELHLGNNFQKFPKEVCELVNLKSLFLGKSPLKKLPPEIRQLQQLEVLDYGDCTRLDLPDTFEKAAALHQVKRVRIHQKSLKTLPVSITRMVGVEEIDLMGCILLDWEDVVQVLSKMLHLKTLRLKVNNQVPPANMVLLKHLKTIQIDFPASQIYSAPHGSHFYLPLEWGGFESTQFESNVPFFEKTNEFIEKYGQSDYSKERKMFFYGVYAGNFDGLLEKIENPLKKAAFKIDHTVFFVTGKIGGFTQKEVKEKFAQYGIQMSAKITPRVTHAIIGRFTKPDIVAQIMKLPIAIVLEDYLKDFIWSRDRPYLMSEDTSDMTKPVLDLLMSEDEGNFRLALQIIEGGGANPKIVTYLMVISLFYPDNEIRKEARKLFKKYATSDLQQHVRANWRTSLRDKVQSYYLRGLVKHAELDIGEFMVMRTRVSWAGIRSNVQRSYLKETIDLSQMNLRQLPASVSSLQSIRKINLSANQHLDFQQIIPVLQGLPKLEEITFSNCKMEALPQGLLELKQLKKLDIGHNRLEVLSGHLAQLHQLEELILDGNPLQKIEPEFYQLKSLKKLFIRNCALETLTPDIEQLKNLQVLSLNNNQLKSLPDALESLQSVKELHLSNNLLEQLPAGLGKLENLVRIGLKNNKLKKLPEELHWSSIYKLDLENNLLETLPESIINCEYLNEIKLRGNKIRTLPESLVHLSAYYFNIDISHNGLSEVPAVLGKIKQLRTLNLSHNQLTYLPEALSKAHQLYYLRAANNKISDLPANFYQMVKLSSIDLSYNQIKELPDQLPPAFQDANVYRGTFALYGNPILPEQRKEYLQKFKGLRF